MPRVTICIPTIGRADYLPHALRSVAGQSFDDIEILVLDNASPPAAREWLDGWAATDRRARILRVEPRIGMFENFNRGIAAASGEYLAFCHDDDEVAPQYVARCTDFMDRNPRVAFCGPNYSVIDGNGRVIERRHAIRRDVVWSGRDYILRILRSGRNPLTMQGIFYRRRAFPAGGLDTTLSLHFGDFVFLMRMAEVADVGAIAPDLVRVRRHSGQASASVPMREQMLLRTRLLSAYCDEFATRHPRETALVRRMRRASRLAHRTGLAWSWLVASDEREAAACADALGSRVVDRSLRAVLHRLSHAGLRRRTPAALAGIAHRVAARFGL
jgi:glycosyltransferase involved in cell wall biosynthesis